METKQIGIKVKSIPEPRKKSGNTQKILDTIQRGEILAITNKETNLQTIRSYIEKKHKDGELMNYTVQQRSSKNGTGNEKFVTLYITHETSKPKKPEETKQ